ncbi:MAG: hypothetical protein L6Q37_15495 [Bdellovibrionaceae bacterium]|nr:hypothetical protein [Pseudobdellovibrionaceae bacterium]NUM57327.1 hypothetical protein [Pseudobdellovibrionaceae bacterium]
MVHLKLKTQRKYFLFSGRIFLDQSLHLRKVSNEDAVILNSSNKSFLSKAFFLLEKIKIDMNLGLHAFVWSEIEVTFLFSLEAANENICLLEIEKRLFFPLGFTLEKPCLCQPLWTQSMIWEGYQQAYQQRQKANFKYLDSFSLILRGSPYRYLFEDHLNLIFNPVQVMKQLSVDKIL